MINLTIPAPQNATEANAQAVRYQRARAIIAEGYTFSTDDDLNCIYVMKPGRLSFDYIIYGDANNITEKAGCDCPDSQKGNVCKHYIAAWILQEEAREEADAAQVAAYEAEMAACENPNTGVDPYWF